MPINSRLLLNICLCFSSLFSLTANAAGSSPQNSWFLSVGGGASKISLPDDTTVNNGFSVPAPNNQDIYTITSPTAAIAQIDIGYRWYNKKSRYLPYYSAAFQYRHYFHSNIEGNVDQFSLPGFVNYDYELNYEADLFTLNGKVDLVQYHHFLPYLSGGLGFISNHLNSYSETPLGGVTPRVSPGYSGTTTTSFAGTLGLGIDYIVTDSIWLTLGYDHVFQGDIKTGTGVGGWAGTSLDIGNVKMDTVFLSISANFPRAFTY